MFSESKQLTTALAKRQRLVAGGEGWRWLATLVSQLMLWQLWLSSLGNVFVARLFVGVVVVVVADVVLVAEAFICLRVFSVILFFSATHC